MDDQLSLLHLWGVLVRRRRWVIGTIAGALVVALAWALLTRTTYTATVSFMPQGSETPSSRLAGLAGQFGIQVPQQTGTESPQFYATLVTSRKMLLALSEEDLSFPVSADSAEPDTLRGTLPDLLELEDAETPWPLRREAAVRWLAERAVGVSTSRETGIVTVRVTTPWAGLSLRLAEGILAKVNEFNVETRQSHAAAERTFVSTQLAEAQDSLRRAENRLEAFLRENRQWQSSPELAFQHDRLQRQVAMRQQLYTSLAESYDAARIAEVRNTPVITVVESPEIPIRRDPKGRILKMALGLAAGLTLGALLALLAESSERARRSRGLPDVG